MTAKRVLCPGGCGGTKSARARFCASCRARANELGDEVLRRVPTANPAAARSRAQTMLRTPEQNRAYHGKCGAIARLRGRNARTVKTEALTLASQLFERKVESSTELSELEMDRLLDHLDAQLALLEQPETT